MLALSQANPTNCLSKYRVLLSPVSMPQEGRTQNQEWTFAIPGRKPDTTPGSNEFLDMDRSKGHSGKLRPCGNARSQVRPGSMFENWKRSIKARHHCIPEQSY